MKIWHISDTHTYHKLLSIPKDIDVIIHSGDAALVREVSFNSIEMWDFIHWFGSLPIKYKIFVPGNHDTSIEHRLIKKTDFTDNGIIYLENSSVNIEGLNFYGCPYTPAYGEGWSFNRSRDKMHDVWQSIPENTDILITHGPPKSILDLTEDREHNLVQTGCTSLYKTLQKLPNIKYHMFGHLHDDDGTCINAGILVHKNKTYSNGTVLTDRKFGEITSGGNIIELTDIYSKIAMRGNVHTLYDPTAKLSTVHLTNNIQINEA